MKTRKPSPATTTDSEEARLAAIRKRAKDRFGELLLTKGSTQLLMSFVATRKVNQEIYGTEREWMDYALEAELARRRRRFN